MVTNETESNDCQTSFTGFDSQFNQRLERIKTAVDAKTDTELAQALGINRHNISHARKTGQIPHAWVVKISEQNCISADWILYGVGQIRRDQVEEVDKTNQCLLPGDFVTLPLLESKVAAGPEGEILYEEVSDYYPFKRWWIERISGRAPERQGYLLLIKVRGDSMSPTINQGEIAMIDTYESERLDIRTGRIYLIRMHDGSTAIKRLALSESAGRLKLICMSDNVASYRPFDLELDPGKPLQYYVLGRVKWAGKEFD